MIQHQSSLLGKVCEPLLCCESLKLQQLQPKVFSKCRSAPHISCRLVPPYKAASAQRWWWWASVHELLSSGHFNNISVGLWFDSSTMLHFVLLKPLLGRLSCRCLAAALVELQFTNWSIDIHIRISLWHINNTRTTWTWVFCLKKIFHFADGFRQVSNMTFTAGHGLEQHCSFKQMYKSLHSAGFTAGI